MSRYDFPHIIDNTQRGTFVECPTKWRNSFVWNRAPVGHNVHLHAGGAFAAGLESTRKAFYRDGMSEQDSIAIGLTRLWEFYGTFEPDERNKQKGVDYMARALVAYFTRYKLAEDYLQPVMVAGQPLVELTFAEPIDVAHPQTGDPILYAGRFDMFATHRAYGVNFVNDEKTSKQLGAQWIKQWDTAAQFTGYCWASKRLGLNPAGAIIRGIGLLVNETTFAEAITYRDEWRIDRWYQQLLRDVKRMIQAWETDTYDRAEDHACNNYGECLYTKTCFHRDGDARLLSDEFKSRDWNPLAKDPEESR